MSTFVWFGQWIFYACFSLQYLGLVEVEESRGMHVCEEAVKKLKVVSISHTNPHTHPHKHPYTHTHAHTHTPTHTHTHTHTHRQLVM